MDAQRICASRRRVAGQENKMFTRQNTHGYTEQQIAKLNTELAERTRGMDPESAEFRETEKAFADEIAQRGTEQWETTSFTVRRPGCSCWKDGIRTMAEAMEERERANRIAPGHVVYAEQRYIGDLPGLVGGDRCVRKTA